MWPSSQRGSIFFVVGRRVTRLADVTRPAGQAFFAPMIRPRVLQRIDEAAAGRVVLIVAPAGYGKSLALSQWLTHHSCAFVRFNVQPEHNTLVGFARGVAEALAPASPALLTTVATAVQSSASATMPGIEMARWVAANIERFNGVIAVDDFHRAADDPEISRFLASLIARTKSHVQWVIATRSALDLPVASWLAYGDAHFLIGDRDLTFSHSETHDLCARTGQLFPAPALGEVIQATAGWPVALGLALRSPAVIDSEKNLSVATREVLFQYLAEQVYDDLTRGERDVLHFASYLPEIRTDVLEAAGYTEPAHVLEGIRRRMTMLSLEAPGAYKCHDLFREFLQREIETRDPGAARTIRTEAAKALESVGDLVAALRLYTKQRAAPDIVRILNARGFDLLDHAHGDVVEAALTVLPQDIRSTDAVLLGLRAQRQADLGHFDRAENFFRRAIAATESEIVSLRLAILLAVILRNQGRQISNLLLPFSRRTVPLEERAEMLSLLAVDNALSSNRDQALCWIEAAEKVCHLVESPRVRAKTLLRLGIALLGIGADKAAVFSRLREAAKTAEVGGMLATASKAYNVLGMAQLFYVAGPRVALASSRKASETAVKSGDRFALHSALAYSIEAETCLGNDKNLESILLQFDAAATSDTRRHRMIVNHARATLAAWRGKFHEAALLMDDVARYGYGYYGSDKAFNKATHALYVAAADRSNKRSPLKADSFRFVPDESYPYGTQKRCIAILFSCLAELFAGRSERARRRLRAQSLPWSDGALALFDTVRLIADGAKMNSRQVRAKLEPAWISGLGGVCRTIESCAVRLASRAPVAPASLTPAELQVLIDVDQGFRPKEIAARSSRSIHTVRTLIQRSIQKLGCSGRDEALNTARRMGLLGASQDVTKEGLG